MYAFVSIGDSENIEKQDCLIVKSIEHGGWPSLLAMGKVQTVHVRINTGACVCMYVCVRVCCRTCDCVKPNDSLSAPL